MPTRADAVVLFGVTGDLVFKKLFPALYEMARLSYAKNDNLRARAFVQRLEAVTPPEPAILELAERIESRLGDKAAAKKYRERLKQEFPDYEPVSTTEGTPSP